MPVPKKICDTCGRKMTYDPILSKKKSKSRLTAFWCTNCDYIMVQEKFYVKDKVQSVKNYLFYGKLPKLDSGVKG